MAYAATLPASAASGSGSSATGARAKAPPLWPAKLLLLSLAVPFFFPVGPIFLTADRIVLIIAFAPCFFLWASGRIGRKIFADYALLGYCLWMGLSSFILDGPSIAVEAVGINFIESFGAYLVGRCMVRDADAFRSIVRFFFLMILLMLPFALHETVTSRNMLLEIANRVWPSYGDVPKDPRWGFDRVALTFYHPILYGVFCGACFGLTYYVLGYGCSAFMRFLKAFIVAFACFLSLSSGPMTALVAQLCVTVWDRVLKNFRKRWTVLITGVVCAWGGLAMVANRSVPEIFLTYFAFNTGTAYNRIRIWEFGTITVQQNPILGIGLTGDWFRPWWMSGSMDMFWLVPAVKHGLPAGILMHLTFLGIFVAVANKRGLSERAASYRMGLLVSLLGFYLAGWTVHYWKVIYVLFMFLLGTGGWFLSPAAQADTEAAPPPEPEETRRSRYARGGPATGSRPDAAPRYSRFPARPRAPRQT